MATGLLSICAISLIARGTSTCPETKYLVSGTCPIPDAYLTASSEWLPQHRIYDNHSPGRSRLDSKAQTVNRTMMWGAWSPQTNDAQQWIQARFLERSYVTGIVTQGRNVGPENGLYQRVTSYQFQFSKDCVHFVTITESNGDSKIFPGNTDQDSHVTNMLPSAVCALCVRILPVTWVLHISLRFDVLGCSCGNSSIQLIALEESGSGYKYGMIASLIVAVVAIVTIVMMISYSGRKESAEVNQPYTETCVVYNDLDRQNEEDEPYTFINEGQS